MAANGNLIFQDTNKATFVGANSNVVIDTVNASFGVGVDVNGPTSNLHVVGNAYVTSNLEVGTANLFVDTVNSRVGVGTTDPGNTLEVAGTASVAILKSAADAAATTYNYILNGPRPGTTSGGAQHFINGSTRTTDGGASTYTIRNNAGKLRLGDASYDTLIEGGNVSLRVMSGHETEGTLKFSRADGTDRVHNIKVYNSSTQIDNYMKFQIHAGGSSPGTLTDDVLYLRGDGNVGIGTAEPLEKLDVRGTIIAPVVSYLSNQDAAYLIAGTSGYTGAATNWDTHGFQHRIKSNSSGTPRITVDAPSGGEVFTIENGGNVGIGEDNPSCKLTVGDDTVSVNSTGGVLGIRQKGDTSSDGITLTSSHDNSTRMYKDGNGHFNLYNTGGGTFTLENVTGNVGIGVTTPTEALQIYRDGTDPTYIWAIGNTSDRAGIAFSEDATDKHAIIEYDGTGSDAGNYLAIYSGVSSWVGKGGGLNYIPQNGRVGIGTNNPQGQLHISSGTSGDCVLILQADTDNNNESDNPRIEFRQDGELIESAIAQGDNDLQLKNGLTGITFWTGTSLSGSSDYITNTVERMRLDSGGNLGINDSTPGYKLDVNGTLRCFGFTDSSSDDRIKYNEQGVSNALTLISQLNPQKYEKIMERPNPIEGTWIPTDEEWENVKEDYKYGDEYGFIAQDVRAVPELSFLVTGEETRTDTKTSTPEEYSNLTTEEQSTYTISYLHGSNVVTQEEYSNLNPEEQGLYSTQYTKQFETQTPLGLNYQGLFVLAIGAIQELKAENEAIKARLEALENA